MTEDTEFAKNLQDAFDKCEELLSEFMEAGIIIGTYRDEDGDTRKWSQSWGNDFAVTKIVEVEAMETHITNVTCSGHEED